MGSIEVEEMVVVLVMVLETVVVAEVLDMVIRSGWRW